jgi:hypothetical protein
MCRKLGKPPFLSLTIRHSCSFSLRKNWVINGNNPMNEKSVTSLNSDTFFRLWTEARWLGCSPNQPGDWRIFLPQACLAHQGEMDDPANLIRDSPSYCQLVFGPNRIWTWPWECSIGTRPWNWIPENFWLQKLTHKLSHWPYLRTRLVCMGNLCNDRVLLLAIRVLTPTYPQLYPNQLQATSNPFHVRYLVAPERGCGGIEYIGLFIIGVEGGI